MLKLHHYLMASASLALVGYAGLASQAEAKTCFGDPNCSLGASAYTFGANDIFGGGSTLIGPYWRQMSDCYNGYADLVIQGPSAVDTTLFNYTNKAQPQNCATTQIATGTTTWYINAGSGNGIGSFFTHNPSIKFGNVNTHGPQTFPEEFYSASDAGLSGPNTTSGTDTYCYINGNCTEKLPIGAPGTPCNQTGTYPVPVQCYGPLIQIPVSVDDVAIMFNPVYEKVVAPGEKEVDYSFRTTAIKFSKNTLCGIFEGTITNWNDPSITADNGGTSLESKKDPTPAWNGTTGWSVPLVAVGRTDGSGTTSIVTRHLAAVCGDTIYTVGTQNLPGAVAGSAWSGINEYPGVDTLGKITTATGSTGVAYYTAFTTPPNGFGNKCSAGTVLPTGYAGGDCIQQGRVGYAGADYSEPYVKASLAVSVALDAVELENSTGAYVKTGPTGALAAFTTAGSPPTSSSACPESDASCWVESLSASVPLANPSGKTSYPLVGTTQVFLYQCYANSGPESTLVGQLSYVYGAKINTDSKAGILAKVGLAPLPTNWLTAIENAFVTGSDNQGLNIQTVNTASNATGNCANPGGTTNMLVGG